MDILLNFARLSDAHAATLRRAVEDAGHRVVAITSHRGEDLERFGSGIQVEHWHDYSGRVAAIPWLRRPSLREILQQDEIERLFAVVERPAPRVGGMSETMWRANCDLARAHSLLERSGAEAVVSLDDPETGVDLCVEALARTSGRPSLWLRRGLTGLARCAASNPYDPIIGADGAISPSILSIAERSSAQTSRARDAVDAMIGGRDPGVLPPLERRLITRTSPADVLERAIRRIPGVNAALKHRPLVSGPAFLRGLRRELERNSEDAPSGRPTCVLALHYQPELSTLTMGGWGTRQLEVAKFLADNLPSDWHLVVREHPSTFWAGSGTSATFRPPGFYARIARLPRTSLLPPAGSPEPPAPETRLVVTASGTMGAQALAQGIPVIHLGRAAYANFRGAGWLRRPDPLEFESLLTDILALRPAEIRDGFVRSAATVDAVSFSPSSSDAIMVRALEHAIRRWSEAD